MFRVFILRILLLSITRNFGIWVDFILNYHWNTYPFGKQKKKKKAFYIELWNKEKSNIYPEIDQYEKNIGYKVDKSWFDNLALHTQVVIKTSPLCWQHGRVLFASLSNYLNDNPIEVIPVVTIWETGTARGFSALCMSKAIEEQGRVARIITFDVLPHNQRMFWGCIDDHDGPKSRSELLRPWRNLGSKYLIFYQGDSKINLKKVATERIHFAFLDGSHTYKDIIFEFNQIKDYQCSGDVIVFDDYNESKFPGLVRAVDEICSCFEYSRVEISANQDRGYVIATKN
jgi:hypothetical protein